MTVLSIKYPGSLHVCENCGAVLAYHATDVYEGHYIYCAVCKAKQKCNMDLEYDGVITKDEKKM